MDSKPGSLGKAQNNGPGDLFQITHDQFLADRNARTRGTANPSIMNKPFWKYMAINGGDAYNARGLFDNKEDVHEDGEFDHMKDPEWPLSPIWCFDRFGHTVTVLPDGRHVYIGGEHEDSYDPDFAIYNDVIVVNRASASPTTEEVIVNDDSDPSDARGPIYYEHALCLATPENITIYGYPVDVFPPTDFHTATYFRDPASGNEYIFIIGGLGYPHSASRARTDIYRLSLSGFSMERLETTGAKPPGGTDQHNAQLTHGENSAEPAIRVTTKDGKVFSLLINNLEWTLHGSAPA